MKFKMFYQKEATFQSKFIRELGKIPMARFEKMSQRSKIGTPDIIGCVAGHYVALELKRSSAEAPSPMQNLNLKGYVAAGGVAFVVHPENAETILAFLHWLSGHGTGLNVDCFKQIESRGDVGCGYFHDSDGQIVPLS